MIRLRRRSMKCYGSAVKMTDKKFEDNDPSAYCRFIAYVVMGERGCARFLRELEARPALSQATWVQDVNLLNRRPSWLTGVPAIVHKEEKTAHQGEPAFAFLREFVDDEISFGGGSKLSHGFTGFGFDDGKAGDGMGMTMSMDDAFMLEEDRDSSSSSASASSSKPPTERELKRQRNEAELHAKHEAYMSGREAQATRKAPSAPPRF